MRKISRRSFLAVSAAAAAAGILSACGSSSSSTAASTASSAAASAGSAASAASGESYTVGICQLVEHEALDAATQGFQDALTDQFGDAVTFDLQNAQNDTATCATICNGFVSAGVDLILANATAALQAAQAATADIPVLGTSITEYGVALGLDDFDGTVGGNISGTSDLAPLDEQAAMILEWMPEAKTAGLLYCSAEANSQYQVDESTAEKYEIPMGIQIADVMKGGPAERAGLRAGDIIYKVNDTLIQSFDDLSDIIDNCKVGDTLRVLADRNGQKVTANVTLAEGNN